jgi:hypothetical protein
MTTLSRMARLGNQSGCLACIRVHSSLSLAGSFSVSSPAHGRYISYMRLRYGDSKRCSYGSPRPRQALHMVVTISYMRLRNRYSNRCSLASPRPRRALPRARPFIQLGQPLCDPLALPRARRAAALTGGGGGGGVLLIIACSMFRSIHPVVTFIRKRCSLYYIQKVLSLLHSL